MNHFTNILSKCSISIIVKEFISPRCMKLATSLVDHIRLGPNTMARLEAVILLTEPLSATYNAREREREKEREREREREKERIQE